MVPCLCLNVTVLFDQLNDAVFVLVRSLSVRGALLGLNSNVHFISAIKGHIMSSLIGREILETSLKRVEIVLERFWFNLNK